MLLAGAQLGITLSSLGLGAVAEPAVAHVLEAVLHVLQLPAALADPIAFAVALACVVVVHMVIGEMVPKNVALAGPEATALLLVPALDTFVRWAGPVLRALNGLANAGLRLASVQAREELKSAYTPDELADIVAESRQEGLLAPDEHDRLSSALAMHARTVSEVMVPIAQLVTLPPAATSAELEAAAVRTGFSRFPVPVDGTARLAGYLHVKDVLITDTPVLHQLPTLDAAITLPDALTTLRRARSHIAAVTRGPHTIGAVTLQDVLAAFVGEIAD
jgi:CBS domain containing-hemolysin-like protein